MNVPSYQEFMFPIIKLLSNGKIWQKRVIYHDVASMMHLTTEQMDETLPSQTQPTYINRIGWALTYLKKAGLILSPSRSNYKITDEGNRVVAENITNLNTAYLRRYPQFVEFQNIDGKNTHRHEGVFEEEKTPMEKILEGNEILKKSVCDDLLNKILEQSPYAFEQLVVDLIVAMGYGGNIADAGKATKKSGDEGIDGLVKEDKLGLDTIYIQAKRYNRDNLVGHPTIQQFFGALQLKGARKGIFITTSDFTKQAIEAVNRNNSNSVVLINGKNLVELMYEYNVGVSVEKTITIKRVDSDYFDTL